jgi:hypothetical protein
MIDYCDQSTEGVGQGFNARFGSGESGGYCDQSTEEQPEQGRASSWEFVCLLISLAVLVISISLLNTFHSSTNALDSSTSDFALLLLALFPLSFAAAGTCIFRIFFGIGLFQGIWHASKARAFVYLLISLAVLGISVGLINAFQPSFAAILALGPFFLALAAAGTSMFRILFRWP